jgi:aryl-alcohol dehydrogenase-like predicted oxidoreductase
MRHLNLGTSGVSASVLGLGCMAMANAYGEVRDADANDTLRRALDLGINHFDTADVYANGSSERLLSQLLKSHRHEIVIATKGGATRTADNKPSNDGSPKYLRQACEASLKRLAIDCIDLYYLHRVDPHVPIEESVGALADLVKEGKVRAVGLSEVAPAMLRRAHSIHPIAALQTEFSLGFQDPDREILPLCQELGITFVAYSPLGRGLWSGAMGSDHVFEPGDIRASIPRFVEENMKANLVLVDSLRQIAAAEGITVAQLALAWVLSRGDHVIAIPGTRSPERLALNVAAAGIRLSAQAQAALDSFPFAAIKGARHTKYMLSRINLENTDERI